MLRRKSLVLNLKFGKPLIPFSNKIRNKVEASHQKREQSKQLLEIAKTGGQQTFETDKATATTWINRR